MKRLIVGLVAVAFVAGMVAMAEEAAKPAAAEAPAAVKAEPAKAAAPAAKATSMSLCEKCGKSALKAGKCCEADMTAMKVLAVKDGKANLCACKADCKCTLKADDPYKCSCGKDVREVGMTGKFVCAEGKCTVVSDAAGQCACGKDLKKAE